MEKELIAFEDVRQLAQKMHNAGLRELEWRGGRGGGSAIVLPLG